MAEADLRNMIMNFRVSDLQVLLGFAGRNKTGKKQELQSRALDLTKMKSPAVELKIKELHNRRYHNQLGSRPSNYDINDRTLTDRPLSNYEPSMNNNYVTRCNPNVRPMSMNQGPSPSYSGKPYIPPIPQSQYPPPLDVKFKELPFYDTLHVLMKPFNLLSDPVERLQESTYSFHLTPQQAHDVAVSKDSSGNYECQVLLRFCLVEPIPEQDDNFPPNISVKINTKPVPLPNPIPTNRPGVEPKRPSRPVNVTPFIKLSPTVTNILSVTWSSAYSRVYGAEITIARLLTSSILLQRLRSRGIRNADHTKIMIIDKLQAGQDSDIATTSLQASLICPLGKLKMELPCRASTCSHIACFDASLYIQLNEKKPKWRCPVCDKPALFKHLILDGLFMDILSCVSPECTDVQLHDDGSWTPILPVKEPKKEVKTEVLEQAKKKPSKPVELVDLSSDSDGDDTWKDNKSNSRNSQDTESPPLMYIPHCPTPPATAYSPVSSMMAPNYASVPQLGDPIPVCLTSTMQSELPSSEHLNILPDVISHPESSMPSTSLLGSAYPPYLSDSSAFSANTSNTFQDQSASDNNQTCETPVPVNNLNLLSIFHLPESEQQNYQNSVIETSVKDSTPDIISLD